MDPRADLIQKRKLLTAEEVQRLSLRTIEAFLQKADFLRNGQPKRVALYRSMPREMDLTTLEAALRKLNHKLYFPRVRDRNQKALEFVEVGPNDTFQSGPYSIQEPHPELQAADPATLDIIIVPGVGFGPNGERIGMGAGYYDRFLPLAPQALRAALAFDFQLLPRLDQKPWDQAVHWIVTDAREAKTSRAISWLESHKS